MTPERFQIVQRNWRLCRAGEPWGGRDQHKPWRNQDMVHNLLRSFKGYVRAACIAWSGSFTLTTLRKSFSQNLADAGVPMKTTAKLLGDETRVVNTYYQQVSEASERDAIDTLNKQIKKRAKRKNPAGAS